MALFICANAVHIELSQLIRLTAHPEIFKCLGFEILGKIGALKLIALRQKALECLEIYGEGINIHCSLA